MVGPHHSVLEENRLSLNCSSVFKSCVSLSVWDAVELEDVAVIGNYVMDFNWISSTGNNLRLYVFKVEYKILQCICLKLQRQISYRCHETLRLWNYTALDARLEDVLEPFLYLLEGIADER